MSPDTIPTACVKSLDKRPYFSLYKDNYFIGGTTIGSKPTNKNSDVKFQLSISQRLTKSKLPFDTYLFITYTQKAFWNVFQESLPMYDLNFNPGIGLSHLVIHRNRLIGQVSLLIEHESNGKDSIWSRSWNKISFMGALAVDRNVEPSIQNMDTYHRQREQPGYPQILRYFSISR